MNILKTFIIIILTHSLMACSTIPEEKAIHELIDNWHNAAAEADADKYFGFMADGSVFICPNDDNVNYNYCAHEWVMDWIETIYKDRQKALNLRPDNAEVYVNGEFRGTAPLNLHLAAGTHKVELRLEGYQVWERELTVVAGNDTRVAATLQPE